MHAFANGDIPFRKRRVGVPMLSVVYIGGYGRSGSTVLELELARRLGGLASGELWRLFALPPDDAPCSCGKPVSACVRWGRVLESTLATGTHPEVSRVLSEAEHSNAVRHSEAVDSWKRTWSDVLRSLDESDVGLLIDSSKTTGGTRRPNLMAELCAELGYPFLFVQNSRDPRGVLFSAFKGSNRDLEGNLEPGSRAYRVARASVGWLRAETSAARYRSGLEPDRSVVVRYEQFVDDPAAVSEAVEASLSSMGACFGRSTDIAHGIAGNRVRRGGTSSRLVLDDQWRTDLPSSLKTIGGALNRYRAVATRQRPVKR